VEDAFEAVTSAGSRSEADPAPVRCRTDATLEGHCRQVVAFVDDDQPVAVEDFGGVVAAGQCLEGDEVDDPAAAGPSGAELAACALWRRTSRDRGGPPAPAL
jgi:hypothetical protein